MVYSVQQIKFEFVSYVKEFGADFREWSVGVADDARRALFVENGVDETGDVWLWKPALTPAAAAMIRSWLVDRHGVANVSADASGPEIYLFKRRSAES
ncbi:hypothetical protein [Methylobacterium gnaphalii]|uniref:Uncharacterized protein n=1 Tax=Methylobacterium gnaphalii TaxID=1010610 RepID=A0A512JQ11_9HYPH|nr:hypothetical protein [Methylobacterium gnaphalii]GEP12054.1 hypothetical protein MGN01_38990 [Methylobacterium gnaphalii]GJD70703.1 hypothetical protein MMMDOFMJ_3656 [Methylobacterium gnaphalii]GLS48645.1 hypothetical protein GCM10007885_14890 [Methylobacterium gnaphalii]